MSPHLNATGIALVALISLGAWSSGFALPRTKVGAQAFLDSGFIRNTVESLADKVEAEYFDPAMGTKIASKLREELSRGQYGKIPDAEALATLLTSDMYGVAKDKHLILRPTMVPAIQASPKSALLEETRGERGKRENFGLQKIEILPGNIGYLRVTAFYRPEETRESIADAMAFLHHAEALIVDLRDHGGGASPTVALFTSYFLDEPNMLLFAISPRPPGAPRQYLTEPGTLINRNAIRPTFLLTSPGTSSGGEGVAFLLQERHRALVIGEVTWGGANQVPNPRPVTQGLQAFIPNGLMRSALTGRSWEGVGVIPDVSVSADRALRLAHTLAIQALLRSATEGNRQERLKRDLALAEVQLGSNPSKN